MSFWLETCLQWKGSEVENIAYKDSKVVSPSWETDSSLDSPEISCILWNLYVHYRGHTSLLLFPILSKVNPVCILPFSLNIHLYIILPYVPSSSIPSPSFGICHSNPYAFLFNSIRATCLFRCVLASYEKYLAIEETRPEGKKVPEFWDHIWYIIQERQIYQSPE